MKKATLRINGMSCSHCVAVVRSALEGVPDLKVSDVTVGIATVQFSGEEEVLRKAAEALEQAGYSSTASSTA